MKAKKFYEARSTELHEKLAAAQRAVVAVEQEINENIRLVNIAPPVDDEEAAPSPPPPVAKPAVKVAAKRV